MKLLRQKELELQEARRRGLSDNEIAAAKELSSRTPKPFMYWVHWIWLQDKRTMRISAPNGDWVAAGERHWQERKHVPMVEFDEIFNCSTRTWDGGDL